MNLSGFPHITSRAEVFPLNMPAYNPKFKTYLKNSKMEVIGVLAEIFYPTTIKLSHPIIAFWKGTRCLVDVMVMKSGFSVSRPLENVSLA